MDKNLKKFVGDSETILNFLHQLLPTRKNTVYDISTPGGRSWVQRTQGQLGTYRAKLHSNDDPDGWIIIHWPRLASNILYQCGVELPYAGPGMRIRERALPSNQEPAYHSFWPLLKTTFLNYCAPLQAVFWSHEGLPQDIVSATTEGPTEAFNDPCQYTVLRAPHLLKRKSSLPLAEVLSPYLFMSAINRLNMNLPEYLELLFFAASRSVTSNNPLQEWGLFWTRYGLYFNHATALERIQRELDSPAVFHLDPFNLRVNLGDPDLLGTIKFSPGFFDVSSLIHEESVRRCPQVLSEINMLPQLYSYSAPSDAHILKIDALKDLLNKLQTETRSMTHITPSQVKTVHKPKEWTRTEGTIEIDPSFFGYDAVKHGDQLLSFVMAPACRTYFISIPDVFTDALQFINDEENFKRHKFRQRNKTELFVRRKPRRKHYEKREGFIDGHWVKIHREPLDFKTVCVVRDNLLFLNPVICQPDGELSEVIRAYLSTLGNSRQRDMLLSLLDAFNQIMRWVFKPKEFLEGMYSEEFGVMAALPKEAPISLDTIEDRLKLLYDRGISTKRPELAHMPLEGANAARSKKRTSWEAFAAWYANTYEVPALPVRLTRKQTADYIAKRWVPSRRASVVYYEVSPVEQPRDEALVYEKPSLEKGGYVLFEKYGRTAPKKIDVDVLVDWANANMGRPF